MLSWLPADGPLYGLSWSALMGNLRQHLIRLASHRTFMWLMTFNVQSPSCRPDLGELADGPGFGPIPPPAGNLAP